MKEFTTRFFDGVHIDAFEIKVTISDETLEIESITPEKELKLTWHLQNLVLVQRPDEGKPGKISESNMPNSRLIINHPAVFDELRQHIASHNIRKSDVNLSWKSLFALLVFAIAVIAGAVWSFPYLAAPIAKIIPAKWVQPLGNYVANSIVNPSSICTNPQGLTSLKQLTDKLIEGSDLKYPLSIKVAKSSTANALTVPGGQIIILSKLLETVSGPDELAGIIAHEMGHAVNKHPLEGLIRELGISTILIGAGVSTNVPQTLFQQKYRRDAEREADKFAIELLQNAKISIKGEAISGVFEIESARYQRNNGSEKNKAIITNV